MPKYWIKSCLYQRKSGHSPPSAAQSEGLEWQPHPLDTGRKPGLVASRRQFTFATAGGGHNKKKRNEGHALPATDDNAEAEGERVAEDGGRGVTSEQGSSRPPPLSRRCPSQPALAGFSSPARPAGLTAPHTSRRCSLLRRPPPRHPELGG